MMKEAIVEINQYIKTNALDVILLGQVHDECIYAIKETLDVELIAQTIHDMLVSVANRYLTTVKMKASYVIKNTWIKE